VSEIFEEEEEEMSVTIERVLISDNVDKKCDDLLKANGIKVITKCGLSPSDLIQALEVCIL